MGLKDAVRTCFLEKYITFSGRASRSEFWFFFLFNVLIIAGFFIVILLFGGLGALQNGDINALFTGAFAVFGIAFALYGLAVILPSIAVTVRRFHDVNISGWWYLGCYLAGLIPIIGIVGTFAPYVIALIKGNSGENRFGPDPLVEQNPADVFA